MCGEDGWAKARLGMGPGTLLHLEPVRHWHLTRPRHAKCSRSRGACGERSRIVVFSGGLDKNEASRMTPDTVCTSQDNYHYDQSLQTLLNPSLLYVKEIPSLH